MPWQQGRETNGLDVLVGLAGDFSSHQANEKIGNVGASRETWQRVSALLQLNKFSAQVLNE